MEIAGIPLLPFIGLVLTFVSFGFDIIGLAAPYWWKLDDSNGGLWRQCTTSVCVATTNSEIWFRGVQAIEVLGFICLLAASVAVVLQLFVMKDKPMLKAVAVGCLVVVVAAIGAIAAAAMFRLDK